MANLGGSTPASSNSLGESLFLFPGNDQVAPLTGQAESSDLRDLLGEHSGHQGLSYPLAVPPMLPHMAAMQGFQQRAQPQAGMALLGSFAPGSLPDLGSLGTSPSGHGSPDMLPHSNSAANMADDSPDDLTAHRERNRLAQRKFRQRQKEKMRTSQKQLDELTQRVAVLLAEKSQLETRNRILEQVVSLNTTHEQMLHANAEIMTREQEILCEELAQFVNLLEGRSDLGVEDAKRWTMQELMEEIYPKYVHRVRGLVAEGRREPTGQAAAELDKLMITWREHEKRRALFSCFYWAVYSWNLEAMQGAKPPAQPAWRAMLDGLQLTPQQEQTMLGARRHLLQRLHGVGRERKELLSALGLELLQTAQEDWPRCKAVQQLQRNLGAERAAVFSFMFSLCDETLTSVQEAFLDTQSFPWAPDIWQITCLLALRRGERAQAALPDLDVGGPALKPLLPHVMPFAFLTQPLMAQGLGTKLKRGILKSPFQTVVPAAAFPTPSIADLQNRTVFDVHCGGYRQIQFWDYMQQNLPDLVAVLPH